MSVPDPIRHKLPLSIQLTLASLGLFVAVLGIALLQVTATSARQSKEIVTNQQDIENSREQIGIALDAISALSTGHPDILRDLIADVVRLRELIKAQGGDPGPLPHVLITTSRPSPSPTPARSTP